MDTSGSIRADRTRRKPLSRQGLSKNASPIGTMRKENHFRLAVSILQFLKRLIKILQRLCCPFLPKNHVGNAENAIGSPFKSYNQGC
jgi:hypothetical protein